MAQNLGNVPDDVLYQVCIRMLRDRWSMKKIAKLLESKGYDKANLELPRHMLKEALDRNLISIRRHQDLETADRVERKSGTQCKVSAVEDDYPVEFDHLAELAADRVLDLIRLVHQNGQSIEPPRNEVHIGLAAGGTSRAFASHLASKLRQAKDLPVIWLHTLTSGFFVDNPDSAPVVSLGQFKDIEPKPHYVVLHSAPLESAEEAKMLRKRPLAREAFARATEIDIVVTSVSVANHEHSLFGRAIDMEDPELAQSRKMKLDKQGWAGDIMWQPFSKEGKLIDCDVHAVSVVNFGDLVRLSNSPGKHVVCIAGLCASCEETKLKAIVPLMRCDSKNRPFNHLVTTKKIAQKICDELGWNDD
jgi:hypothetical protein